MLRGHRTDEYTINDVALDGDDLYIKVRNKQRSGNMFAPAVIVYRTFIEISKEDIVGATEIVVNENNYV